jgi:hypothetical protein
MTLLEYLESIPYDGMSQLIVNGYKFKWNGLWWDYEKD